MAVDDADAGDAIAIDDADEVAANIEENTVEKTAEDENNEISASEEGQVLSKDQSEDVLSTNPVKANQYKIEFTKSISNQSYQWFVYIQDCKGIQLFTFSN